MDHCGDVSFEDDLIDNRPSQLTQRRCNMLSPTETSHNAHTEIDFFSHAVPLCRRTQFLHTAANNVYGENQTFDEQTSDTFRHLMSRPHQTHKNAVAAVNDS